MTDVSKQILEKAHGGLKLNPDEQRRFLGTFEERVLGYAELATANDDRFQKGFLTILETFKKKLNLCLSRFLLKLSLKNKFFI